LLFGKKSNYIKNINNVPKKKCVSYQTCSTVTANKELPFLGKAVTLGRAVLLLAQFLNGDILVIIFYAGAH
jgi:hypothetical protein